MDTKPFQLTPPDDLTQATLENMRRSPASRPTDPRYVTFYTRSKRNAEASAKEGRPVFEAVEYVTILTPGDKDTIVDRPVRETDRYCWPEKYTAFRNNLTQDTGMPLSEWQGVSPERVKELEYFRIRTVEQLADVADAQLPNLGPSARADREKAKSYLAVMKGAAPVAELKAENDELRKRLEALEALSRQGAPEKQKQAK